MPFVRFSRDKRGYEHIYLVHASQGRGRSGPAKILYWYRTPPGVRVGREPFDEHVRRALEAEYPNLQFDWKRIVNTPIPPADAENWREKRRLLKEMRVARAEGERSSDERDRPAPPSPAEEPAYAAPDVLIESAPEENAPTAGIVAEASITEASIAEGMPAPSGRPGEELRRRRRRGGRRRRRGRGPLPQQPVAPAESDPISEPVSASAAPQSESGSESDSHSETYTTTGSQAETETNADRVSKTEPDLESDPGDQK